MAVANLPINSGERAHAFASYMRIHALEATGGQTYAQMARYATADGKGTNDAATALKGDNGQPLDNPVRQVRVTETALATALNTSYMADQLSLFGIAVGIALMLSGIGFGVVAPRAERCDTGRPRLACVRSLSPVRSPRPRRCSPSNPPPTNGVVHHRRVARRPAGCRFPARGRAAQVASDKVGCR